MIVFAQRTLTRPHIDHDARNFMAEDGGEQTFRVATRERVAIGVADARSLDFNQLLASPWALQINGLDGQGCAGFPGNCGLGFYGLSFRNCRIGSSVRSGASSCAKWPTPGKGASVALGMAAT